MIDRDAYRAWKERVFGNEYSIWHDGLYTDAVTDLTGAAREEALAMLRFGAAAGDSHASEALAAMGDVDSLASVRAQIEATDGSERVRAALAAHRLLPDPTLAEPVIGVLRGAPFWSARIDAAIGLRHFEGAPDEEALLEAVARDPEYLVRFHAAESLLARWRVRPAALEKHGELFEHLRGPHEGEPTAEDFATFARGRALLEALRR